VASLHGRLFAKLRRALHAGARLVTFDTDFERFVDLDRCVLVALKV